MNLRSEAMADTENKERWIHTSGILERDAIAAWLQEVRVLRSKNFVTIWNLKGLRGDEDRSVLANGKKACAEKSW